MMAGIMSSSDLVSGGGGGGGATSSGVVAAAETAERPPSASQEHLIPLYFRVVPKDLWVRMHVDVRATIGAVKDALLDRLDMPPHDPSLSTGFYDEAKTAMSSRPAGQPQDNRAFPKAFVARTPKQSVRDVLLAEREAKEARAAATSSLTAKSGGAPARRTPNFRSVPAADQARAILGGDIGNGGRGSMGFMSVYARHPDTQANAYSKFSRKRPQEPQQQPTSPRAAAQLRSPVKTAPQQEAQPEALPPERPLPDADLETYMSYFGGGLPGNEEAKRSEEAAMAALLALSPRSKAAAANNGIEEDATASSDVLDRLLSPTNDSFAQSSRKASKELEGEDDMPVDDELDSGDTAYKELVARSRSISLHSVSSDSMDDKEVSLNEIGAAIAAAAANSAPSSAGSHSQRGAYVSSAIGSSSPTSSTRERARSGTIMPGDVRRGKAAAIASAAGLQRSSTSSTGYARSASSDVNVSQSTDEESRQAFANVMRSAPTTPPGLLAMAEPLPSTSVLPTPSVTTEHEALRLKPSINRLTAQGSAPRRLAGIHPDEISSWKEAQHGQARHYSLYSFSNGHLLEDWRTVAAFRIRPYELLEVHFADRRDKVHLPRIGEAIELSRKPVPSRNKEDANANASGAATAPYVNPAFDMQYLDWFCEGWCYIYKHGGGKSKAQRAGLGLWKLRYVSLRGTNFFVFRRKEARTAVEQMYNMWSLEAVEAIISERADGATRPPLLPLPGLCQDTLTLTFTPVRAQALMDGGTGPIFRQPPLSMRFVTQIDHCAFFNACARAHHHSALLQTQPSRAALAVEWRTKALARATIAGRGGTVLPGKAARRAGRNALARARLRPSGISRDFDDADRWSSESEAEAISSAGSVAIGEDGGDGPEFTYSDAAVHSYTLMTDSMPLSPAVYGGPGGGDGGSIIGTPGLTAPLSPELAKFTPTMLEPSPASTSRFSFKTRSAESVGRSRGFTVGNSRHDDGDAPGGSSSSDSRGLASRLFMSPPPSGRVGLGVTAETSSPPAATLFSSSPTRTRPATVDGDVSGHTLAMPRSPNTATMRRPPSSPFHVGNDGGAASGISNSGVSAYAASLAAPSSPAQRPIVSPPTAEEQSSPAAQAIHSFLASQRRSSSHTSPAVGRARAHATMESAQLNLDDDDDDDDVFGDSRVRH